MINIYKLHSFWTMWSFCELNSSPLSFFIIYLKSLIWRFLWILKLLNQSFHLFLKIIHYALNFWHINFNLLLLFSFLNYISYFFSNNISNIQYLPNTLPSFLNINILATCLLVVRNWWIRIWRMYIAILHITLIRNFLLLLFLWTWILTFYQLFQSHFFLLLTIITESIPIFICWVGSFNVNFFHNNSFIEL